MVTRSIRARVRAAALASALSLAACAGDDSSSDTATTTASPGAASPSTAAPDTTAPPTTRSADTGTQATTIAPAAKTVGFLAHNTNPGIPVSFTVPADAVVTDSLVLSPTHWTIDKGWGAHKGAEKDVLGVQFAVITNIYAGDCQQELLAPPLGPTVGDLAQAWANQPQYSATPAVDVTIDGYAGKQVGFTVPDDNHGECSADYPGFLWQVGGAPGFGALPSQHIEQRILDVNGTRLVISEYYTPTSPPQDRAALDEALASIQIG